MKYIPKQILVSAGRIILLFILILLFSRIANSVQAQTSSTVYMPLIGITSVPYPLALPQGAGTVTYNYAVKNFIKETPLTKIQVVDNKCSPVKFIEGDDNHNGLLDYNETWRYTCSTKLTQTTQNTATATGIANNITATHKAYSTVIVGSSTPPPLVSIINITKVAYPLSLPSQGGDITFTYKVTNPGIIPLSSVVVTDNKCTAISGKLGDTNNNNLLDINEVWIYTCITKLTQTTTNTAYVTAFANGLKAIDYATLTVKVAPQSIQAISIQPSQVSPNLPSTGGQPNPKMFIWGILAVILIGLIIFFMLSREKEIKKSLKDLKLFEKSKPQ